MFKFLRMLVVMVSAMVLNAGNNVEFVTSLGNFIVELNPTSAPITVKNFLYYVNSGFYTNTVFHRVINGFVIQGGGFDENLTQKTTGEPIVLESKNGLKNDKYTIAMARTSVPDSATSQFYINLQNNDMLNYPQPDGNGYAVFGKVISGFDTVDKISFVSTKNINSMADVPVENIVILAVRVKNDQDL